MFITDHTVIELFARFFLNPHWIFFLFHIELKMAAKCSACWKKVLGPAVVSTSRLSLPVACWDRLCLLWRWTGSRKGMDGIGHRFSHKTSVSLKYRWHTNQAQDNTDPLSSKWIELLIDMEQHYHSLGVDFVLYSLSFREEPGSLVAECSTCFSVLCYNPKPVGSLCPDWDNSSLKVSTD